MNEWIDLQSTLRPHFTHHFLRQCKYQKTTYRFSRNRMDCNSIDGMSYHPCQVSNVICKNIL